MKMVGYYDGLNMSEEEAAALKKVNYSQTFLDSHKWELFYLYYYYLSLADSFGNKNLDSGNLDSEERMSIREVFF